MRLITTTGWLMILSLTGCLLPAGRKVSRGYRPSSHTLEFLQMPDTMRRDVIENLGPPLLQSESTGTFVYVWEELPRYIFVRPNRLLSDHPATRASIDYGSAEQWALLVAFDAAGHVLDYEERYIDTRSLEEECAEWHRSRAK